jgi:hypothetical protein
MAKNYTLIKRLHGYQVCPPCSEVGESTSTISVLFTCRA